MRHWRLTPRTWARESFDAKAHMLAFMLFENTVEAYRQEWKAAHKEGRVTNKSDHSHFAAMRERMKV